MEHKKLQQHFHLQHSLFHHSPTNHNVAYNEVWCVFCFGRGALPFYSLSINSSTVGGSGAKPFRFLISEIIAANLDFGISAHALK